jgi:uncharacterized tellurite resistance protein B-like protein
VVIGDRTIGGGGFYFGGQLPAAQRPGSEPAVVDPSLKVDWKRPDWAGAGLRYWPSYDDIPAGTRAAYLGWLASDRSQPETNVGFAFLNFYGFERRVLEDFALRPDGPEFDLILAECKRLLSVYGANDSFRRYVKDFVELLEVSQAIMAPTLPSPLIEYERGWETPATIRVALGRFAAADMAIPDAWALAWARHHPDIHPRTPAQRCPAEFADLFAQRYHAHYGEGLRVRTSNSCLQLRYRPASSSFVGEFEAKFSNMPDVSSLLGPVGQLKDLVTDCTDALDAYSRFLGRNPQSAGTPAAVALLPSELLATHGGQHVAQLRAWLPEQTGPGASPVAWADVAARCGFQQTKLAKSDAVAVASLLGKLGVGIEPDVRFGASTPGPSVPALLFQLPPNATDAPSGAYKAAATLVHLAAVVAGSDGGVSVGEAEHLERHLEHVLGLDEGERTRLNAHLRWLVSSRSGLGGLKRRLDALDAPARHKVGQFLVGVAAADGVVSPQEITMLIKVYKMLDLSESDVYSAVHSYGITDLGPVPVSDSATETTRWSLPEAPTATDTKRLVLDQNKIEARIAETAAVRDMLAGIFAEDEPETPLHSTPSQSPAIPDADTVLGLDAAHSSLLAELISAPEWSRADLEAVAERHGIVLIDPAIDRINDAALEGCGEPLLEGDDPFELNTYAVQELLDHV